MIPINIFQEIEIPADSIQINKETILSLLGYEQDDSDPFVIETIQDCIFRTKNLLHPKGGFIFKSISSLTPSGGIVSFDSTELYCGKIITQQIKNSSVLCIFAVTIGEKIEKLSEQLFHKGEMLEGYIVNLIGSEAAESAAEYMHNHIKDFVYPEGLNCSNRYSPGYCSWNVAEQFKLFAQFNTGYKEIQLTESALMKPVKSVSGIIGIGENVHYRNYTCAICKQKNCIFRKNKEV